MYLRGQDQRTSDDELLEFLAELSPRPYDFVLAAFPWGELGELEKRPGPEKWQRDLLMYIQEKLLAGFSRDETIAEAIQCAVKSGHDIGKSACVCWLILWAVSTREDTKGVVTANTEKQLRLKLWAELSKWHRLFIGSRFFKVTATSIQATDPAREKEWRIDAIPWSEDNPEAFAGLHNYGKRILVVFDEASGIVDKIWETIDGVMNERDTELIWVATGNPTRNIGRFVECFDPDGQGQFWHTFTVDSREVSFTNKERIQRAIDLYGIDNDVIKVRWLGQFPSSSTQQLIPKDSIRTARHCEAQSHDYEPLIMGVDVARYGSDDSVIVFRRGKDARTIPAKRFHGLSTTQLGTEVVALIATYGPDAVFIDEGGIGGGVIDFVRHLGHHVIGVNFGSEGQMSNLGEPSYNKRAEMYLNLRDWIRTGGAIEDSRELEQELVAIEYTIWDGKGKKSGSFLLTPKEDMDDSPDWADALALTFAFPVSKVTWKGAGASRTEYDPFSDDALHGRERVPFHRMGLQPQRDYNPFDNFGTVH